jgi:ribonuclease HIII
MEARNIFVATIDLSLASKLKSDLIEQGFELSQPPYTIFSAKKKGLCCTLYMSGKLTVQGKEMQPFIEFYLEPEILKEFQFTYKQQAQSEETVDVGGRIGIDESGKGDFFGPLCIAGVFAEGEGIAKLKEIGVRDSKSLTDTAIVKIGRQIKANFAHHIIRINPIKYNEIYASFNNLNSLLAWGHATTIEQLVKSSDCHRVVVDQFAAEWVVIQALKKKQVEVDLLQRHRAEEDVVVAAASILARQSFIEGLEELGKQIGITLPKGASPQVVAAGRRIVLEHGREVLPQLCKMHFKTLSSIS